MKKLFLFIMTAILSASLAWAADVSVVETYGTNLVAGSSTTRTSFQGRYTEWWYRNARSGATDQLNDGTNGFWLSRTSGSSCYLESTLEGGIKNVAFNWRQFGTGDNGYSFVLNINTKIGSAASVTQKSITWTGAKSYVNNDQSYSQAVAIKANDVKLTIQNVSTQSDGTTAGGRILVGPITITPYLLYTQKDANVLLSQTGYIHEIIDNTDKEGTVSYESWNTSVAEVNASTGEIIPRAAGDAVITATWSEGVTTTYTVHVINGVVETFGAVTQTKVNATVANWSAADLCNWETHYARRGSNDQMNGKQYSWLTLAEGVRGYIKTTNLEGGIKDVSFHYGQFGAEAETLLRWQVSAIGTATTSDVIERDGDLGENRSYSRGAYYTHAFNCAENAQLEIKNMSVKDDESQPTSNARLMVSDIYITPYLLYTTKAVTLDTRNGLTCTNAGLINNTSGDAVVYSIAPEGNGVSINATTGEVTAENDEVEGNFEVTATWGSVTTTYTLTVTSRTATTASYPNAKVEVELNGTIDNALAYTAGYDGTIGYASSNTAVADFEAGVLTIKGVGETTITATLPQTDNYKTAEASYKLYVEDNSASVQVEAFSAISTGGAASHAGQLWQGDVCAWRVSSCGGVRKSTDVFASDQTRGGIWMGTPDPNTNYGSLTAENGVEGGIKHLWFYVEQPYNTGETGYTLKPVVYLDEAVVANKVGEVEVVGASGANNIAANRRLFGASNVTKSNSVLIIQNESYLTEDGMRPSGSRGRLLLDEIHITPYLLYATKEAEMDMRIATTFTNNDLINNTESGSITYSLEDNDEEATINASTGEVTALKAGEVTVKATWSEGAFTTYTLTILSKVVTEASFAEPVKRVGLDALAISNTLTYTDGYDGTIAYSSSNTAVATVNEETGAVALKKGVGQTTITATLPATDNYEATSASYTIYVRDNGARIEDYSNVHIGDGVVGNEGTDWTGVYFDWHVEGAIRHNASDTIWGKTNPDNVKVWIATAASTNETPISAGVMASKDVVEGGIKYLSFYWKQWASESNRTLRIAAFDGETRKGYMEYVPSGASTQEKFLFGVNDMMRNNHVLSIKNESFKTEIFDGTIADDGNASRSRIIIDDIYITPYLLYADKAKRVMRVGGTDKNESLINNTGADASYESSNTAVATVAADGTVTAVSRGKATITASYKWSEDEEVSTWYEVEVWPVNCETFDDIEQTSNYGNTTPKEGDKATWSTSLGGFNVGDCGALTTNLARFRAPYQESSDEAYIQSTAIEGGIASLTFDWNLGGAETATNWDIRVIINGREVKRLNNEDITATNAMDHFEQFTINDIDEPGNFTIRFENHSTINGAYTSGNKARFLIDNITWTNYEGTKMLAEDDATNESWIRSNAGQTCNVTITRSPMVANVWNTLCLPFAISKSTDLGGAEVQYFSGATLSDDGQELTVSFTPLQDDELVAGTPYLVKPTADKEITGTYSDKQITSVASPISYSIITMQGIFSPYAMTAGDTKTLFVAAPDEVGRNLFYPSEDGSLKGFRAYFKLNLGSGQQAPKHARFVVNQKDVTTDVETVMGYGLQVTGTQKILRDGQLFILRGDKLYDATGRLVK